MRMSSPPHLPGLAEGVSASLAKHSCTWPACGASVQDSQAATGAACVPQCEGDLAAEDRFPL